MIFMSLITNIVSVNAKEIHGAYDLGLPSSTGIFRRIYPKMRWNSKLGVILCGLTNIMPENDLEVPSAHDPKFISSPRIFRNLPLNALKFLTRGYFTWFFTNNLLTIIYKQFMGILSHNGIWGFMIPDVHFDNFLPLTLKRVEICHPGIFYVADYEYHIRKCPRGTPCLRPGYTSSPGILRSLP